MKIFLNFRIKKFKQKIIAIQIMYKIKIQIIKYKKITNKMNKIKKHNTKFKRNNKKKIF